MKLFFGMIQVVILLFCCFILGFTGLVWFYFGSVTVEQVLYHLLMPLPVSFFLKFWQIAISGIGIIFIVLYLSVVIRQYIATKKTSIQWMVMTLIAVVSLGTSAQLLPCYEFIANYFDRTSIYEDEYKKVVSFESVAETQPDNLVIVFLESFENAYARSDIWGKNFIPQLSRQQEAALSFPGYHSTKATGWTIAGQLAFFCGVPLKPLIGNTMSQAYQFFPNLTCWPELLSKEGYTIQFLKAASLNFSGTESFLNMHGFDKTEGFDELKATGEVTEEDFGLSEWGAKDAKILELAQKRILRLAEQTKPFVFVIETVDTHGPEGYSEPSCTQEEGMLGAVECADKNVSDFVNWFKQQPFYKNTRLIIIGDHLLYMSLTGHMDKMGLTTDKRAVYTAFHAYDQQPQIIHKDWTMVDMAATVPEWLGYQLPDHRFGLGRSLLADEPTLYEKYRENLEKEWDKRSSMYEGFMK